MALGLCFSGIVTMVGMDVFSGSQLSIQATLMGLASGVCYAFYILLLKKIPKQLLGLVSNAYVCGVITLAAFPMAVNHFDQLTWGGLAVLIICGVTIQGIATTAYMNGLRQVKAQQASILSYTEALFATIFSVIFLQETVSFKFVPRSLSDCWRRHAGDCGGKKSGSGGREANGKNIMEEPTNG